MSRGACKAPQKWAANYSATNHSANNPRWAGFRFAQHCYAISHLRSQSYGAQAVRTPSAPIYVCAVTYERFKLADCVGIHAGSARRRAAALRSELPTL